ncbi:hypothetical protein [Herpetosiphon geysericola]|uniref:Uncharacterized protein n=1 Tax=Herpetosiphon geysericola TaxID=70996 RepID=A0A0P6XV97_9CHLR|nr:hypothetical protein [Herpetosiphon geysericola]KPL83039.1 hypothetical protein SE18_19545 [Herpetosiphon geysericola]
MSKRHVIVGQHTRSMPLRTFTIICRWCGNEATIESYPGRTPTLCSPECLEAARKDHDRQRKAAQRANKPAPATPRGRKPMPRPQRFVVWPSQLNRSLDRSIDRQLTAMKTKFDGRNLIATLETLLVEYLAVNVRWVILECFVREPQKLAERTEVVLTTIDDPEHKHNQWQRELDTLRSEFARNGTLNQAQREQLWAIARPIEFAVVGRHGLSQDYQERLTGAQRATAERALAAALVRLEALLLDRESA